MSPAAGPAVDASEASVSGASVGGGESDEVDPIAEADVYMAYGRDAQAEEILKDALKKDPQRQEIYLKLLEIHAQQVYTIGIVSQALQPIVAKNRVRNVPAEGLWSWDPGSYFGMYRPDTFWLEPQESR